MTTKMSTKLRLVRCPKCRLVLPELPGVQLYTCGGCGTILQAKIRNVETNCSASSSSQETDSVAKSQQNNGSVESDNIIGDCVELSEERTVSGGLSSSPEITSPENEDLPPIEVKESLKKKDPFAHSYGSFQSRAHHDERGESSRGRSFSNELSTSGELSLEGDVYNPEANEHVEQHKDGESPRVWQGDKFQIQNSPEGENQESVLPPEGIKDNNYVPPENGETSQISSTDPNEEFDSGLKHAGVDSSSEIVYHENNIISQSAEQSNIDGIEDLEQNTETGIGDSIVAPRSSLNESLVSFYLTSPDEEHIDHSPRKDTRNYQRVSSRDTLGSSPLAELNSKHGSISNYPPIGSYYAYDGSESSYDGTDDQIHKRISHPSRKNKNVDYTEMLGNGGLRGNNFVNSDPERNYWATVRSNGWSESESSETNMYTSEKTMRHGKQEGFSRLPFTSRDHFVVHSPSRYRHDILPPRPHHSSERPQWSEPDKTDLLRTVCELKDQLNRMRLPEAAPNRRFPDEKFAPFHYNHLPAAEREIYYGHGDFSRSAFSGEAAHYRHHHSCSCRHCCPQDCHYSAQLPSHCKNNGHCKNGHCGVHTDHNRYTSSDETKRMRSKEKYRIAKRCLRPTAGGAPIVACYRCWELLQLPADFLLFEKRYHRLKCNACGKVLKFSLLEGTRIVPYLPEASAPPRSEAEGRGGATSVRNPEPPPARYGSSHKVEHVSSFDDYGRSSRGSLSTVPSIDRGHVMDSYGGKMSSEGSYDAVGGERKMKSVLRESQHKTESSMKSVESPRWRKGNSEIEEVGTSSNSPLHRLMGYSSPSQVLWRSD